MKIFKRAVVGLFLAVLTVNSAVVYNGETASAAQSPTATKTIIMKKGEQKSIRVTGTNIISKKYVSADTKIATVNGKGVVKAKKAGKCKVTITVKYRKTKKTKKITTKNLSCTVTVKNALDSSSNTSSKKNEKEVVALQKIIREQRAKGAAVSTDINNKQYAWGKDGHLKKISWFKCGLKGKLSFTSFSDLTSLYFAFNQLTSLDVSKNKKLQHLDCGDNQLNSLNVSKNTALTYLHCRSNRFTSLDVRKNTALTYLDCGYNRLNGLNVSKNTALKILYFFENKVTNLDVSKNIALEELNCGYNPLSNLDVRKNTALKHLDCSGNQLTSLDVSKNIFLEKLFCEKNNFVSLDISNNIHLKSFWYDEGVKIIGGREDL